MKKNNSPVQTEEKKLLKPKNDVVFQSIFNQNNTLNKEYTAVILGDVTGNGTINIGDVSKLYQHIRGAFEMDKEFKLAGDVYQDTKIALNDVAKLYQYVRGGIENLEG